MFKISNENEYIEAVNKYFKNRENEIRSNVISDLEYFSQGFKAGEEYTIKRYFVTDERKYILFIFENEHVEEGIITVKFSFGV